ncbi:MAG: nucleotidyltransferase domain-containing protein [Clostridium sp.]|nr:nucleotidyltransferase domain-containing protein [Clostridium sp.]
MPNTISNIIYGFAVELRRLLGNDLSKVILYGSYARGDFGESSDVDVMILVKISPELIEKVEESIFDLAFDIEMEHGIHISPIIKNEEQFEYWADVLPFYRNVRNEGVEING